jgi:broad specificity phosphatase PhoE
MKKLYDEILREHQGQRILIVGHAYTLRTLWEMLYDNNNEDYTYNEVEREVGLKPLEIIKLPTYQIANELDKWILAELNQTIKNVDTFLSSCEIDAAIKS